MRSDLLRFLVLVFSVGLLGSCSPFSQLQKSQDPDEKYAGALRYFVRKDYYHAGIILEDLLPLLKGSNRADTAQLYYAYCQFYERQYQLAAFYFKSYYEQFPKGKFAEEAGYMEGLSHFEDSPRYDLDQESTRDAMRVIQTFMTQYPESERKEDCNFMMDKLRAKLERKYWALAQLYYRKKDYQAAILALENFRREYPESGFVEEAQALRVQSAYELAKSSITGKQPDRYGQVLSLYEAFAERYPESRFLKPLGNYYEAAQGWLDRNRAPKPADKTAGLILPGAN